MVTPTAAAVTDRNRRFLGGIGDDRTSIANGVERQEQRPPMRFRDHPGAIVADQDRNRAPTPVLAITRAPIIPSAAIDHSRRL